MLLEDEGVNNKFNYRQDHIDKSIRFENVDESELIELVPRVEERNVQHVSVLLVKPNNMQRLITLEVPIDNDEYNIMQVVHLLLNEKKNCQLDMYAVVGENYNYDYVIEIDFLQSDNEDDEGIAIVNASEVADIIDKSSSIACSNNSKYNTLFDENDQSIIVSPSVKSSSIDSNHSNKIFCDQILHNKEKDKLEIKVNVKNQAEVLVEIEESFEDNEGKAIVMEKTCYEEEAMEETCYNVDVEVREEYHTNMKSSTSKSIDTSKSDLQTCDENNEAESIIQLENSPILSRRKAKQPNSMLQKINILTIYPASPEKGGVAINSEDFKCLGADEFLNDVIIDFYLKYLMFEVLSMDDRHRTHIFSSHFYTRLAKPYPSTGDNIDDKATTARRHAGVRRWTKNVNIFEKDFVIIPVNEHAHWFLAIICFANLVGTNLKSIDCYDNEEVIKRPCILIFDSLLETRKKRVTRILRGYLHYEYLSKMQESKTFTKSFLPSVYPRVPKQSNVTDCGLFLLQYVENFFKDPIKNFTLPLRDLKNWFNPIIIIRKRKEIATLISLLAKNFNKDKTIILPDILFHEPNVKFTMSKKNKHSLIVSDKKLCRLETEQSQLQKNINSDQSFSKQSIEFLCKVQSNHSLTEKNKKSSSEDETINESFVWCFGHRSVKTYGKIDSPVKSNTKDNKRSKIYCEKSDKTEKTNKSFLSSIDEPMSLISTSNDSLDKHYALSFEALKNDSKISPRMTYSQFLKVRK